MRLNSSPGRQIIGQVTPAATVSQLVERSLPQHLELGNYPFTLI